MIPLVFLAASAALNIVLDLWFVIGLRRGAAGAAEAILEGVRYLRAGGAFYWGIGCLFLLYGLYRALGRPGMSVVLTAISLGTRVALAHLLSAIPGLTCQSTQINSTGFSPGIRKIYPIWNSLAWRLAKFC